MSAPAYVLLSAAHEIVHMQRVQQNELASQGSTDDVVQ